MRARSFEQSFLVFATSKKLLSKGDRVLLGCSGGADSVCLLLLLEKLKRVLEIELFCCHVNHNLRPTSKRDEEYVASICGRFEIPFFCKQIHLPEKLRGNLEEEARLLRHGSLDEAAKNFGCNKIALAHNATDRAETLLHNIARGSGLSGAGTMRPETGKIVRPLLFASKRDIASYLLLLDEPYCTDETNDDVRYSRNRIRKNVIPELEKVFVQAGANISRFADIAQDESDYLDLLARDAMKKCAFEREGHVFLDCKKLSEQNFVIQRRIARIISGDSPSLSAIDLVLKFFMKGENGKSKIVGRARFEKVGKNIVKVLTL
ncbi:MAG: tRNA lysidine(34) synthetase TilS [Caldisericales bacterium]|nr:tRNA lysidine(34) synthetase TilS [Caldisericales bacterium]